MAELEGFGIQIETPNERREYIADSNAWAKFLSRSH